MARLVTLPTHLAWSGQAPYDLDDPADRAALYSVVLSEGGEADIKAWVDVDDLLELWPLVLLPAHTRNTWRSYFKIIRGVNVA